MHNNYSAQIALLSISIWLPLSSACPNAFEFSALLGKQNGGYNVSISVQTLIFHLLVNSTRLKTVYWTLEFVE